MRLVPVPAVLACVLASVACGAPAASSSSPPPPSSRSVSPAPVAQAVAAPAAAPLPDTEFVESDCSRDPFRSFSSLFTPVETPLPDQLRRSCRSSRSTS